ncbi:uncharacterized protein Nmag_1452 [Natrialba magadii ATCC 43099]|uniref:Uncharacterized protein n=1 Tax=Natrialba magadii (strain ATCC 43099 / DSM 3394 / CCM 3739 / CIP 104546 / IAM 13178 / JCM 8861 / NBRC 102185 / NCIMB 2190 / MS3) TaxID=547559 RepID=D3STL3_NATMM|nr:hypothetical protein [Natrialba magadii]ADD05030.1 uncharacterized protein Nmag_1452 [Natrialba magadii ATCC 43099]
MIMSISLISMSGVAAHEPKIKEDIETSNESSDEVINSSNSSDHVTISSGNKSDLVTPNGINQSNSSNYTVHSQEYSDSDLTEDTSNRGHQDLYSEVEGERETDGLQLAAEGEGQTLVAFNEIPDEVTLTSEIQFSGASVSLSVPPGVDFEPDGSTATVTMVIDGDEFDEDEDWHNIQHTYSNVEASSYVSIYGISQEDTITFDYGTEAVTLNQEVGQDCITIWSC